MSDSPIQHIIVLMLENRSFDHLLGFSNITGADAKTGRATRAQGVPTPPPVNVFSDHGETHPYAAAAGNAPFQLSTDPGHEFQNTLTCLCGVDAWRQNTDAHGRLTGAAYPVPAAGQANSGFVANYAAGGANAPGLAMQSLTPEQLPVLNALAKAFVLCDGWFSSLPGPTWPNRYFAHAASSAGLDDSPSDGQIADYYVAGFALPNGTLFDRLDHHGLDWKIIEGDSFPQAFSLRGMTHAALNGHFRDLDDFGELINADDFNAAYLFIEPRYDVHNHYLNGNSMHPLNDARAGEALVKTVYETLRASRIWTNSMLLVLFDEHGGFFDHVFPPAATPPGDTQPGSEHNAHNFAFDRLGLRVPCIVASPWVGENLIDHRQYDHSSIVKTVCELFELGGPLTHRDRDANSLAPLIQSASRQNAPQTLPAPAAGPVGAAATLSGGAPPPSLRGFAQIALARQLSVAPPEQQQAIKDSFNAIQGDPDKAKAFLQAAHDAISAWKARN